MKVAQLCLTLCDPMDCGILQARILERVAFPFSRGSSQPRDRTQACCIAGGFFTSRATREAQEYWSGYPIPSPGDLPNSGIELRPPASQVDSLPAEPPGKQVGAVNPMTTGSMECIGGQSGSVGGARGHCKNTEKMTPVKAMRSRQEVTPSCPPAPP